MAHKKAEEETSVLNLPGKPAPEGGFGDDAPTPGVKPDNPYSNRDSGNRLNGFRWYSQFKDANGEPYFASLEFRDGFFHQGMLLPDEVKTHVHQAQVVSVIRRLKTPEGQTIKGVRRANTDEERKIADWLNTPLWEAVVFEADGLKSTDDLPIRGDKEVREGILISSTVPDKVYTKDGEVIEFNKQQAGKPQLEGVLGARGNFATLQQAFDREGKPVREKEGKQRLRYSLSLRHGKGKKDSPAPAKSESSESGDTPF